MFLLMALELALVGPQAAVVAAEVAAAEELAFEGLTGGGGGAAAAGLVAAEHPWRLAVLKRRQRA